MPSECGPRQAGPRDRTAVLEAITAPSLPCQPLEIRIKEPDTHFSALRSLPGPQEAFPLLVLLRTETNVPPGLNLCSGCGKSVRKKEEVYSWEPPGVPGYRDIQKATPWIVGSSVWRGTRLLGEILKAPGKRCLEGTLGREQAAGQPRGKSGTPHARYARSHHTAGPVKPNEKGASRKIVVPLLSSDAKERHTPRGQRGQ